MAINVLNRERNSDMDMEGGVALAEVEERCEDALEKRVSVGGRNSDMAT